MRCRKREKRCGDEESNESSTHDGLLTGRLQGTSLLTRPNREYNKARQHTLVESSAAHTGLFGAYFCM
jgi:hypothetical protein